MPTGLKKNNSSFYSVLPLLSQMYLKVYDWCDALPDCYEKKIFFDGNKEWGNLIKKGLIKKSLAD